MLAFSFKYVSLSQDSDEFAYTGCDLASETTELILTCKMGEVNL